MRKVTDVKSKRHFYHKRSVQAIDLYESSECSNEGRVSETNDTPYDCESGDSIESEYVQEKYCQVVNKRYNERSSAQRKPRQVIRGQVQNQSHTNSRSAAKPKPSIGDANGHKSVKKTEKLNENSKTCYRCSSDKHWVRDCPEPLPTRIECWRCGKPDYDCRENPKNLELVAGPPPTSGDGPQ